MPLRQFLLASSVSTIALMLGNCAAVDRLAQIGAPPALASIENPETKPGYRPVRMPLPPPEPISTNSNSLWRSGSRAFFKDQRASRVGDILTVRVNVTDRANISNQTRRQRTNSEQQGATNFFGLETLAPAAGIDPANLVNTNSTANSQGQGSVQRAETLTTNVAAVVTQVLPNGNMVIEGKQEVRVNFEIRELIVAGVIRPEDIDTANIIDSSKIAEARIAYGGRGQITDVQQPRYGQQVLDIVLPF